MLIHPPIMPFTVYIAKAVNHLDLGIFMDFFRLHETFQSICEFFFQPEAAFPAPSLTSYPAAPSDPAQKRSEKVPQSRKVSQSLKSKKSVRIARRTVVKSAKFAKKAQT